MLLKKPITFHSIGKLYAKHFKIHEQISALKDKIAVAVGTPNRLNKLIQLNALSLKHTRLVVIDTKKDSKNFTILTLKGVREDMYQFLHGMESGELARTKLALV